MWKEAVVAYLRYCTILFQEELRKTTKLPVSIADLLGEIINRDLSNTKR
jgi:hypothetical protein